MKRAAGKTLETLMVLLILAIGFYPVVSDAWNRRLSNQMIVRYQESLWQQVDGKDPGLMCAAAEEWNRTRVNAGGSALVRELSENERKEYETLLDTDGSGVMGYLEIPKISVSLPIYHGTSDEVLAKGVGHMEGSSLPIGGENTHGILSGHRGLPSAKLFTDLDQLEVGDFFTIHVLNQTLEYQIAEIRTVLPEEAELLQIRQGLDLMTLVTCTPYGVNTHRLLVTGKRKEAVRQDVTEGLEASGEINEANETGGTNGTGKTKGVRMGDRENWQDNANAENDRDVAELRQEESAEGFAGTLQEEMRELLHRPEWVLMGAVLVLIVGILRIVWLWTIDRRRFQRSQRLQMARAGRAAGQ